MLFNIRITIQSWNFKFINILDFINQTLSAPPCFSNVAHSSRNVAEYEALNPNNALESTLDWHSHIYTPTPILIHTKTNNKMAVVFGTSVCRVFGVVHG